MLYDLTSTWVEGRHCPLAKRGHSRDGRPGTLQIEYGLLTDVEGRPIAVEVVPGDTADPATVPAAAEKLQARFGLSDVVLVGDRGMLTQARIEVLRGQGLGWIGSLRAPAIRRLAEAGTLQLGLFDEREPTMLSAMSALNTRQAKASRCPSAESRTRSTTPIVNTGSTNARSRV